MTSKTCTLLTVVCLICCTLGKQVEAKDSVGSELFEFHSSMMINLHHFCYSLAKKSNALNKLDWKPESEKENSALRDTVDYYKNNFSHRDLLFDKELKQIKTELSRIQDAEGLRKAQIPEELRVHLDTIAPIYKKYFWAKHDKSNKYWINSVNNLLDLHGDEIHKRLESVLKAKFYPATRVDTTFKANWAGAYTSANPRHIVISSEKINNQGIASLEMLFHEAVHTGPFNKVYNILWKNLEINNLKDRDQIWHAIHFYTVGEIVKDTLNEKGIKYVPYALKVGLFNTNRKWGQYLPMIEEHWKPYLLGKTNMEDALKKLVADVVKSNHQGSST